MSEEIPYAYQLRHHEQEVERLGTEIDRQRVKIAKLKELNAASLFWFDIAADRNIAADDAPKLLAHVNKMREAAK